MKTVLLIALISIGLCACSKKDDKFDFEVVGIEDITLDVRSVQRYLSVRTLSGATEKVELSISDVPHGIVAKFSSETYLWVAATYVVKKGVYPITITAKSEGGLTKQYKINLIVTQSNSEMLVGRWKHTAMGYDLDGDGVLEDDETDSAQIIRHELVFLSDTTGYVKYDDGTSAQFFVQFAGNPGMILQYDHDSHFLSIEEINATELVLNKYRELYKYKRQ